MTQDEAYLSILARGIVEIRNLLYGSSPRPFTHEFDRVVLHGELAAIEAEHLHNIPTLIGEENKHRHAYYLDAERGLYEARLKELGEPGEEYWAKMNQLYEEAWHVLATV